MSGFYKKDFVEGDGFVINGMVDNLGFIIIFELIVEKVVGIFVFVICSVGDLEDIR